MIEYQPKKVSAQPKQVFSIAPTDLSVKATIVRRQSDGKLWTQKEGSCYLQENELIKTAINHLPYGLGDILIVIDDIDEIVILRDSGLRVQEYIHLTAPFSEMLLFDEEKRFETKPQSNIRKPTMG